MEKHDKIYIDALMDCMDKFTRLQMEADKLNEGKRYKHMLKWRKEVTNWLEYKLGKDHPYVVNSRKRKYGSWIEQK